MNVQIYIVAVHPDPLCAQRLAQGAFRINKELNEEWIDIQNGSEYVLNLQERLLVCCRKTEPGIIFLQKSRLRSTTAIALYPGEKIRIFSGEQPRESTHIPDRDQIHRVLWLVRSTYLWVPAGNEARLYFSSEDLRLKRSPLAKKKIF